MKVLHAAGMAAVLALAAPAVATRRSAGAGRSAELVVPGQPDLERLQAAAGPDYSDPAIQPTVKKWKVALVLTDFPDKGVLHLASRRAARSTARRPRRRTASRATQVPAFYRDFLNKPQALNHGQTMNRYWMEDSYGKYGVQLDAFGPYRLPGNSYQYFLTDQSGAQNNPAHCPQLTPAKPCNLNFRTDARAAWLADVGAAEDRRVRQHLLRLRRRGRVLDLAGVRRDEVEDAGGGAGRVRPQGLRRPRRRPTGPSRATCRGPRGSPSANIWPNASGNTSVEAESSGMGTYAHELTHNLGLPDNYNNPFTAPYQRTGIGHVGHDEPRPVQRRRAASTRAS